MSSYLSVYDFINNELKDESFIYIIEGKEIKYYGNVSNWKELKICSSHTIKSISYKYNYFDAKRAITIYIEGTK